MRRDNGVKPHRGYPNSFIRHDNGRRRGTLSSVAALCLICCALLGCAGKPLFAAPTPAPALVNVTLASTPIPTPTPLPTPVPTPTPDMEPFTIAWLGDTQSYASAYPAQFTQMVRWIVDNREAQRIRYVVHTGDIVNQPVVDAEWEAARTALVQLRGVIPFFAVSGNHDLIGMLTQTGQDYTPYTALMDELSGAEPTYLAGHDKAWRRRFDLLDIGREKFIFIGAGYGLSLGDYEWLDAVLTRYQDRTAVLVAHYYLDFDGALRGEGKHLYNKIVSKHENVKYVLCGHRHRVQHQVQAVDADFDRVAEREVYAFMNDYMGYERGGGGYIVLLTFDPVARTIHATSYSPVLDDYNYFEDETIETYTLPYLE